MQLSTRSPTDQRADAVRVPYLTHVIQNPGGRSAPGRTGSRDPSKSLISMSALPGHHEGRNPPLLLLAGARTGGQTYQMQVLFLTIRPHPSTKPWLQQGMLHHSHQPNPSLPTRPFQIPISPPPSSYPPYPAPRTSLSLPAPFLIPSYPRRCDTVHRRTTTRMKTWRSSRQVKRPRRRQARGSRTHSGGFFPKEHALSSGPRRHLRAPCAHPHLS
ncbi:hypothetical protein EI94DRAFT_1216182 [Lactarius quietus]|nr:hypothetical protein EI94DRAFT_1216182 [Lactarius quietus]